LLRGELVKPCIFGHILEGLRTDLAKTGPVFMVSFVIYFQRHYCCLELGWNFDESIVCISRFIVWLWGD